ncbi:MAG: DNA cytosine methyltransferase [Flavobacteriaceae bacterium]|nr:DNA cytosine methyltransferase [Flavobacteriaceae bacterium]
MKIIDLFSGIGGLSLGFEMESFESVVAIDFWDDAIKTYNHNRKAKVGISMDITKFNDSLLPNIIKEHEIDGIIGGPPCQGFSTARLSNATEKIGKINEGRNHLYLEFFRTVDIVRPKFFLIENVRGLVSANKGAFVKDITERFGDIGYNVTHRILNASNYGVPQNRQRVFFVGLLGGEFEFPEKFDFKVSSKEAIMDLIQSNEEANQNYSTPSKNEYQKLMRNGKKIVKNHEVTIHNEQTTNVISMVPDGGNIKSLPPEYWNIRKYNKAFQRMNSELPSNTIDTGHRNYFHYEANRIPTARESARIQSFPDSFEFLGTKGSQYKQIGNAVPPLLAKVLAKKIKSYLK